MQIREARVDDAEAIARVHVDCWRTTYAQILPAEYLAQLSTAERADHWRRFLSDSRSAEVVYVAADPADGVVGFASGGPERSGELGFSGELWCIYLLERAQRAGVGRRLVSAVAGRLAELGHASMMVWVLADNPSRRFYEALGGTFVTERVIVLGGKSLVEVAYGWRDLRPLVQ
ncbi:MAG: N-acetyltransferase family protein [Deltaproteobacteria bacterium]